MVNEKKRVPWAGGGASHLPACRLPRRSYSGILFSPFLLPAPSPPSLNVNVNLDPLRRSPLHHPPVTRVTLVAGLLLWRSPYYLWVAHNTWGDLSSAQTAFF